ncbi:MAG TPA: M18 family aminopeptidase [Spirochaetales bacterium]|nr:M18 family aminopeptidase [Spirochaetales bacterium]
MPAKHARALCDYIDASPSAFHAVDASVALLKAHGAQGLDERDAWKLEPGSLYYVVQDDASLIAFRAGTKAPADSGFVMAGAHADAPALRVRWEKTVVARGFERAPVEAYGGSIHSTWLDRPLSMAGRVVVRDSSGRAQARLLNLAEPVAVIPNLAIHFNRDMNKGVEYPMQSALMPLVASRASDAPAGSWALARAARELGVKPEDILAAELSFVDAAPSCVWGNDGEFLSAPRIDNLEGCHAVLTAFLAADPADYTQVAVLFDNEEIGSTSQRGADSVFLRDILERISARLGAGQPEDIQRALARSFMVSVDGAQGWHPSYADRFDEDYAPVLNGGPAIKANANIRYATDALGEAAFRSACQAAGVPCQRFRMRADLMPGSTIGPISSAQLGVRTVDVGVPMLAMNSVRETAGAYDHDHMIAALREMYGRGA